MSQSSDERSDDRTARIVVGAVLALAGVGLLSYAVFGLPAKIGGSGEVAGITFHTMRVLSLGAIVFGCWIAYKAWRRL